MIGKNNQYKINTLAQFFLFFFITSLFSPKVLLCHELNSGKIVFELEVNICCTSLKPCVTNTIDLHSKKLPTIEQGFYDGCKDYKLKSETVRRSQPDLKPLNRLKGEPNVHAPWMEVTQCCEATHQDPLGLPATIPTLASLSTVVLLN